MSNSGNKVRIGLFTVTSAMRGGFYVCTSPSDEALVRGEFMDAYGIGQDDRFACEVDRDGRILLETIRKL